MTSFALDENNDIRIVNNQIQMVNGTDLMKQTVKTVIGTNKGEWCLNEDEGINFQNISGKSIPDDEVIKNEIEQGLMQVDNSFAVTSFTADFNSKSRALNVTFQAENEDKMKLQIEKIYE